MAVVINGDTGITQAGEFDSDSTMGFKNRIINGAMVIDQRNAGAAVTTHGQFVIDRWNEAQTGGSASGISVQQSTTVPSSSGFTNSISYSVTTGGSVGTSGSYGLQQRIEGYNFADILSGSANAKQFTLSFWVRSSITGTYGIGLRNSAKDRSYIATYSVSAANTWEQKSITVTADTSGTWLTTNGIGLDIFFDLGAGSSSSTTANSWQAGNYTGLTGGVKLVETSGATFYITGVQLEKGSTATSFDFRSYGTELQLCQRYFSMSYPQGTAPGTATTSGLVGAAAQFAGGAGGSLASVSYPVQMRSTPTISLWDGAGTSNKCSYTGSGNYTIANNGTLHTTGATYISSTSFMLSPTTSAANSQAYVQYTASAEL